MILINEDWAIDASSNQYTLLRISTVQTGKNKGEKAYTGVTYHTSLEDAIKSLVKRDDRICLSKDDMTLYEALKRLEDNHMKMKVLIEGAVPDIEVKLK